jgi:hypothetical protein
MSAAQTYAVKALLKVFGLNADELENKAIEIQKVILEFNPDELRAGLKTLLDYRKNQEQNEKRMLAIMDHFDIHDPCGPDDGSQLTLTLENSNG